MKKIEMAEYGAAHVMKEISAEIPVAGAGEILIKVSAIGVNYSDILRRQNKYFLPTPLPYVLGTEVVGTISQVGNDVSKNTFKIGDKVLAILFEGGYAEYLTANAQFCVPLPSEIDDKEATAIFVQGTTAHILIHQVTKNITGKTILIHAASGGVGSLLVQLGKLAGAKVIAACSTNKKLQIAINNGADIAIDYTKHNWTDELLMQNEDQKVDVIFDGVGGNVFEESKQLLSPKGTLIVYGASSGSFGNINCGELINGNQEVVGFNLGHYIQNEIDLWQTSLGAMIELIASKQVKINVTHVYPLILAHKAHKDIEDRITTGKVVLINKN